MRGILRVCSILRSHRGAPTSNSLQHKRDDVGRDKDDEVPLGFEQRVGGAELGDAVAEDGVCPGGEEGGAEDETEPALAIGV